MTDGSRETLESAQAYLEETGITAPAYFDTSYSAAIAYGVTSLPTTYFIDAQGGAVARAMGAIDADTLQKGIDHDPAPCGINRNCEKRRLCSAQPSF